MINTTRTSYRAFRIINTGDPYFPWTTYNVCAKEMNDYTFKTIKQLKDFIDSYYEG